MELPVAQRGHRSRSARAAALYRAARTWAYPHPFVKANDPHRHLVTVHPVISSSTRGTTPRSLFDPPWRIGGFFGEGNEIDVLSQQTSAAYGAQWDRRSQQWIRTCAADSTAAWFDTTWDEYLDCWSGDVPGANRSVAADRVYRKPVLNTEFGYEYLRGHNNAP